MAVYKPKYEDPASKDSRKRDKRRKKVLIESEVFWCDFTYQGRRIRESTGQSLVTLAKKYEERRRRELENAVAGVTAMKSADRIKDLKTAIEEWIEVRAAGKKPGTKRFIQDRCAHLIEHLGARLVCDINEKVVAGYIGAREAEGALAISINREVYFLARVLRVDRDTAWPELGRSKKGRAPVGKALTAEEQAAILEAARKNKSKYALPFIATAMYTGFRAGEVRTLRWRQIDFLHGWIRSEQSKTQAGQFREVPLTAELQRILIDHRAFVQKKLKAAPEPGDFIFPFSSRGKPVDSSKPCTNIASAWWQIREDAGVQARLHDLRHTYVTRLIEAGVSEAVVREMVGHVDPVVLRRYTHLRREAKKEAIEKAFSTAPKAHVKDSPKESPSAGETPKQTDGAKSLLV